MVKAKHDLDWLQQQTLWYCHQYSVLKHVLEVAPPISNVCQSSGHSVKCVENYGKTSSRPPTLKPFLDLRDIKSKWVDLS